MNFDEPVILGRTGLKVGRLGIASGCKRLRGRRRGPSSGAVTFFHLGTVVKGFLPGMEGGVEGDRRQGQRDRLVLAAFTYAHNNFLTESCSSGVSKAPASTTPTSSSWGRTLAEAVAAADRRRLAHEGEGARSVHRGLQPQTEAPGELAGEGEFDVLHLRYNAAHRGAEIDIFPYLSEQTGKRPGTVSFTALVRGKLLDPKNMPSGEKPPAAADCYRFVLSNPAVDVCMTGAKTVEQMRENLAVLDSGPDRRRATSGGCAASATVHNHKRA